MIKPYFAALILATMLAACGNGNGSSTTSTNATEPPDAAPTDTNTTAQATDSPDPNGTVAPLLCSDNSLPRYIQIIPLDSQGAENGVVVWGVCHDGTIITSGSVAQ